MFWVISMELLELVAYNLSAPRSAEIDTLLRESMTVLLLLFIKTLLDAEIVILSVTASIRIDILLTSETKDRLPVLAVRETLL